jgi:hypothetical protein
LQFAIKGRGEKERGDEKLRKSVKCAIKGRALLAFGKGRYFEVVVRRRSSRVGVRAAGMSGKILAVLVLLGILIRRESVRT